MHRMIAIAACAALTACASQPAAWVRPDGSTGNLQLDATACEGRRTQARMVGEDGITVTQGGLGRTSDAVFRGCMAERGWMQSGSR